MAHTSQQREVRLVAEYMLENYQAGEYALNVPLGPPLEAQTEGMDLDAALRLSHPWRPRVDAMAWPAGRLVLVEGKIRNIRDGLGHLTIYRGLVPTTPELRDRASRPLELVLLTPWVTGIVAAMAEASGIRVAVFKPPWIDAYVEELGVYFTREYQEARARRLELRRLLGVE